MAALLQTFCLHFRRYC